MRRKHIIEGSTTLCPPVLILAPSCDLWLPRVDFGHGRVVWPVRAPRPSQVFYPWLFAKDNVNGCDDGKSKRSKHSPPSMAETHSSRSRPLSVEVVGYAGATNAIREGPATHCCNAAQNRPICDDLVEKRRSARRSYEQRWERTWNFILGVQVLKVPVAESGRATWSAARRWTMRQETYWSVPTRVPALASPMYCI